MKTDDVENGCKPYALIGRNMRMGDDSTLWLGGVGKRHTRIMFVQTCVNKDEYAEERVERFETVKVDPAACHCPEWVNLKMYAELCGLDVEDCYVTSLIKVLPESVAERKTPKASTVEEFVPWLEEEICAVKPKIIVCVGKPVFDLLSGIKVKESDIHGLWLYSEKYRAKLYFMPGTHLALKPEMDERYKQDFESVKSMYDSLFGEEPEPMPLNYRVVRHSIELVNLVGMLERENATVLSVDCEWGGQVHVDGMLRSLQIAWSPTDAAYIRFMDEDANYAFDVGYREAGRILAKWLDRPEVKYIGHHLSADLSWMSHWLGLEWYDKGMFDTEFALQACDESLELGLDILALRYTDLGKYDWDLIQYRKKHPERNGTGYEYVPDDILIPYAVKDVIAVYRAWPQVRDWLAAQETTKGRTLLDYYNEILNPFVTNVFTWFCLNGMPVDRERLDMMRELYNWTKGELQSDFLKSVVAESELLLSDRLATAGLDDGVYETVSDMVAAGDAAGAVKELHKAVLPDIEAGNSSWSDWAALMDHYVEAPEFNIRSPLQMRNWLFKVKGYEPVKTTSQKENGMPSIDWEKVKSYPPAKQAKFTPAVDKMSMEIFASRYDDAVLKELLELNSVGNVCKAFLKEDEVDEDGELVKENGIHYWVTSDDRLCLNHSTTETGRPRSWNPNVLNYPSWLHARLKSGMQRILADRNAKGQLPDKFKQFLDTGKIPTVRSIVTARPGWCIVEADYQTAEMRGLAWISGDSEMQAQILYPDPNWAYVDPKYVPEGADQEDYVVRLAFPDYITQPADKEKFLMTRAKDGKILEKYTEDQLWRDADGKIKGPRYDFHWATAERGLGKCREIMNKKKDRGAGKTLNFSSGYGGRPPSLKRKVDSDTGADISIDTVTDMLQAIYDSHLVASEFLEFLEDAPKYTNRLVAASGRVRHLHVLGSHMRRDRDNEWGMSSYELNKGLGALGRECRNYFLQESVGASASRACVNLVKFTLEFRKHGLQGGPIVCLYDSVVVHCPENERSIWQKALLLYMTLKVGWAYNDDRGYRVLRYPSDCELNSGWSTAPSADKAAELHNPEYEPTPESLKWIEDILDVQIEHYTDNENDSVYNTWDIDSKQDAIYTKSK